MNGKKILCTALAAAMLTGLLAGCGEPAPVEPTPAPDDMAYQAAGISRDTVLFTVDGTEVTADAYLFWLLNTVAEADYNGLLPEEDDWTTAEIEGTPAAEYLKTQALETSKLYTVVANQAAQAEAALTEEQETANQEQLNQLEEQVGQIYPGMTLQDWLDSQCISKETFLELNSVATLAQNLQEALADNGTLDITDADLDALVDELMGPYRVKHILLAFPKDEAGNVLEITDEEKAVFKAEADTLLAQIRAAEDPYAEFDAVMNERSEDGRDDEGNLYAPDGYLATAGQMVPEFEEASLALPVGEFSEPVESQFGYHLILRMEISDEEQQELRDTVRPYQINMLMTDLNQKWMDEAVVETTEAYASLDPKAFYDKMTELNEAREAARAAANGEDLTETPAPETGTPDPSATGQVG